MFPHSWLYLFCSESVKYFCCVDYSFSLPIMEKASVIPGHGVKVVVVGNQKTEVIVIVLVIDSQVIYNLNVEVIIM